MTIHQTRAYAMRRTHLPILCRHQNHTQQGNNPWWHGVSAHRPSHSRPAHGHVCSADPSLSCSASSPSMKSVRYLLRSPVTKPDRKSSTAASTHPCRERFRNCQCWADQIASATRARRLRTSGDRARARVYPPFSSLSNSSCSRTTRAHASAARTWNPEFALVAALPLC
jgi:hypothetical protein